MRFQNVWDADDSKPEYLSSKGETAVVVAQGLYPKGKDVGLRSRGKGSVRISRCVGRKG